MAEEFGFQHAGGQRRAIDPHERPRLACAVDVNGPRHHLFAGPGFAAQKHRRLGLRHLFDLGQNLVQGRRVPDDGAKIEFAVGIARQDAGVLRKLLGQTAIFAHQVEPLHRLNQNPAQLFAIPRLGHIAVDAPKVDGFDQHIHVGECGHDDADGVGTHITHSPQQLQAGHARHTLVGDHHGDIVLAGQCQRILAAAGEMEREGLAEREAESVQVVAFVVDDQHRKL